MKSRLVVSASIIAVDHSRSLQTPKGSRSSHAPAASQRYLPEFMQESSLGSVSGCRFFLHFSLSPSVHIHDWLSICQLTVLLYTAYIHLHTSFIPFCLSLSLSIWPHVRRASLSLSLACSSSRALSLSCPVCLRCSLPDHKAARTWSGRAYCSVCRFKPFLRPRDCLPCLRKRCGTCSS